MEYSNQGVERNSLKEDVAFLVDAFEEKCPTFTVGSFFGHIRSTFHLFNNLNYEDSKHLKRQNLVQNKKKKKRRPEPRQDIKDPPLAILVFFT